MSFASTFHHESRTAMVFVSITRLRLRYWRYLPYFFWEAQRSIRQARAAPGFLEIALLRDAKAAFWTATLWENGEAMRAFMTTGAHRQAMPRLIVWCDEASVAHWEQEARRLPAWHEAHSRMLREGRASKVRFPTPDHIAGIIAPPRIGIGRELR